MSHLNTFAKLAVAASLFVASVAGATTSSGSLTAQSAFVDRGAVVRDGASFDLALRVDDFIFDGVFATTQLATTDLSTDSLNLRSDFGIGYGIQLGRFDVETSINRLDATAAFGDKAYNEVRLEAGHAFTESIRVFGRAAYPLTAVPSDLYATVGADVRLGQSWKAEVSASAYQLVGSSVSDLRFNDAQARLTYALTDSVSVLVGYSYGDVGRRGEQLSSRALIGASVSF